MTNISFTADGKKQVTPERTYEKLVDEITDEITEEIGSNEITQLNIKLFKRTDSLKEDEHIQEYHWEAKGKTL